MGNLYREDTQQAVDSHCYKDLLLYQVDSDTWNIHGCFRRVHQVGKVNSHSDLSIRSLVWVLLYIQADRYKSREQT